MTDDRQDAEYVQAFTDMLRDVFSRTYEAELPSKNPDDWAEAITEQIQDNGWRVVTVKDWNAMTQAWALGQLR